MPKIINADVIGILQDPYFVQHAAMHLSRERVTLPDGTKLGLILPPCACDNCAGHGKPPDLRQNPGAMAGMSNPGVMSMAGGPGGMIEAGQPGSGRQLLEMHHEMIRVFRFLLEHHAPPLRFFAEWQAGQWHRMAGPNDQGYGPELWDLDDPANLPHEITGMFAVTDPDYLGLVFTGVRRLVNADSGTGDDAVDTLGRYVEQGVLSGPPDGSGFHNTMHEYLAAREGRAAQGAEMNRLAASRFNDYFWSLHLWIDAQYCRLMEKLGQRVDTGGLDPKTLDMCTAASGEMSPAMSMSA